MTPCWQSRHALWASITAIALGGCAGDPPVPRFDVQPQDVRLPVVGSTDTSFRWTPVTVLNTTFFPITVSRVNVGGTHGNLLELRTAASLIEIPIRDARTFELRVKPPSSDADRRRWSTGEFEALLTFTVGGSGEVDMESGEVDTTAWRTVDITLPVAFSFNCDLDGDGHDAEVCGGGDCDDRNPFIHPDAEPVCDGIDNNCNGDVDEGCDPLPGEE